MKKICPTKISRKFSRVNFGFTLIELLVVASILMILSGIGLASYNQFNRRKILDKATQELKSNLRLIQDKALAGEKLSSCSSALDGWYITFTANSYRFYGICDNTEFYDNESPKSKEINLASKKITISSTRQMPSVIRFKPLGHGSEHGLEDSTTITLTYLGSGFSQQVIVSKTGEIK